MAICNAVWRRFHVLWIYAPSPRRWHPEVIWFVTSAARWGGLSSPPRPATPKNGQGRAQGGREATPKNSNMSCVASDKVICRKRPNRRKRQETNRIPNECTKILGEGLTDQHDEEVLILKTQRLKTRWFVEKRLANWKGRKQIKFQTNALKIGRGHEEVPI